MTNGRLGTLLLCLLPMTSFAKDYVAARGELRESISQPSGCFDLSNASIPECIAHFSDESDKDLKETLNRIRQQLKKDLALFDETQAKWADFRESQCALESAPARVYANPDREEILFRAACQAKLNAQRVLQLKELSLGCYACLE